MKKLKISKYFKKTKSLYFMMHDKYGDIPNMDKN